MAFSAATWIADLIAPTRSLVGLRLRLVCEPETGQRHADEADAEFLQRATARVGLGQALGEFIESVVHTFPFVCLVGLIGVSDIGETVLIKVPRRSPVE
jgi:hypothetical protein